MSQTSSLCSSDFGAELERELGREITGCSSEQRIVQPHKRLKTDSNNCEHVAIGEVVEETDDFNDYLTMQNPLLPSMDSKSDTEDEQQKLENQQGEQQQSNQHKNKCVHPVIFHKLCAVCGEEVQDDQNELFGNSKKHVSMKYLHKELQVSHQQINQLKALNANELLAQRKLILVLDLDHTLLNSIQADHLMEVDKQLLQDVQEKEKKSSQKQLLYSLADEKLWTKLRPGVWKLLEEANQRYQLYIYTHGEKAYAAEIQKVLDPDNKLFGGRVIGLEDSTKRYKKDLDIVMGRQELVVILDDSETVWQKYAQNLITIKRYFYFNDEMVARTGIGEGHLRKLTDEQPDQDILISISEALSQIHDAFFNGVVQRKDVRQVITEVRGKTLAGVSILFTRVFPRQNQPQNERYWKMGQALGADCVLDIGDSVTHVVAGANGTEKAQWGKKNCKYVVSVKWLLDCFYNWRRLDESHYSMI